MQAEMRRLHILLLIMTILITTITAVTNDLNHSEQETVLNHSEQETALQNELFENYHNNSPPSHSTTLDMGQFRLLHLDMDESEHFIEVTGWYNWGWNDPRLSWDQTKYNKISSIRIPASKIWRPDIVIASSYQSMDWTNFLLNYLEHHGNVNVNVNVNVTVIIYPDGSVLYIPPGNLQSDCVADLTYWPHDVHNCTTSMGSWVHDGNFWNVTIQNDKFELGDFQNSDASNLSRSEWELVYHKVSQNIKYYTCCEEPNLSVTFEMTVKRNAPSLPYTFKIPAVGLSFLSLFVFLLPPATGEKLLLSSLLLLMDLLFLIYTSDVVQNSTTIIPIVVQIVSEQLYLVLISLIVSVIALRMARPPHGEQLSSCIMGPLRALAPLILLGKYSNMSKNYHPVHGKDEVELGDSMSMTLPLDARRAKEHGDWILIAAIFDRILFIVYFFIVMANMIAYTSVL